MNKSEVVIVEQTSGYLIGRLGEIVGSFVVLMSPFSIYLEPSTGQREPPTVVFVYPPFVDQKDSMKINLDRVEKLISPPPKRVVELYNKVSQSRPETSANYVHRKQLPN